MQRHSNATHRATRRQPRQATTLLECATLDRQAYRARLELSPATTVSRVGTCILPMMYSLARGLHCIPSNNIIYYTSRVFVQVRIQSVHMHKPTHVHVHTKSENRKSKSENQKRRARIKLEERESNSKSENQTRRARIKIEEQERKVH